MAVKRFFKLETAIPCHYGSFPIIEPNADAFVAEMKGARDQGDRAGEGQGVRGVRRAARERRRVKVYKG